MYELLNIANKFKGKHFYYCDLRERQGCLSYQEVRKLCVRVVQYVDDDMELVCVGNVLSPSPIRVKIPLDKLVNNKSFSMELNYRTCIISTEKQEIERFLKRNYNRTIRDAWCSNDYTILHARQVYNKLLTTLKKL